MTASTGKLIRKISRTRFTHPLTRAEGHINVYETSRGVIVDTWLPPGMNWDRNLPEWRDRIKSLAEARTAWKRRADYFISHGFARAA